MTDPEPTKKPNHSEPSIPSTSAKPEPQPTHWWDKAKPYVECSGVLLLAIYTIYTIKMYHANQQAANAAETAAKAAKDSVDLQFKITEGSQAAWLIPSQQDLNRNFLSFGVQNVGGISAENVAVTAEIKLVRTSDNQILWTEPFVFETVKYLAPKQNTNGQRERTLPKYTRQNFDHITKQRETLILNWAATYNNGFKREVQQSGCVQYLALFKAPEVRAIPQWVGCEGAPQLLRQLQPPSEQWSLQ
jgi:Ca2+/Na+ antiporter